MIGRNRWEHPVESADNSNPAFDRAKESMTGARLCSGFTFPPAFLVAEGDRDGDGERLQKWVVVGNEGLVSVAELDIGTIDALGFA